MGRIDDLANAYVDEWAALNPIGATSVGIAGFDDQLDDFSPDGYVAKADLTRRTLASIEASEPENESERVAKAAMQERLGLELARHDAGVTTSEISVIASALHATREALDLMPTDGEKAVSDIAARLGQVPRALDQYRRTLLGAADAGHVGARPQLLKVADQCEMWINPDVDDFFRRLVRDLQAGGALRAELDKGAVAPPRRLRDSPTSSGPSWRPAARTRRRWGGSATS